MKMKSSYFIRTTTVLVILLGLCSNLCAQVSAADGETKDANNSGKTLSLKAVDTISSDSPKTLKDVKDDKLLGEQKALFFGEDTNGVPIVAGTWFRYGSYTLAFCMFGTAFLIACSASAVYYVLFVVTEPSQQRSAKPEPWNVGRILRALQLAYDTYESLDPYSPACQLKTICEIQESEHFQGSALKRLSHFIVHSNLVRQKIPNARDLEAADKIGNDPGQKCGDKFTDCRFSLNHLYDSYLTL